MTSARLIAAFTVLSRLLGLIREQLLAYFLSTSGLLSSFRIAFMLPNLARRLFGEGALSAAMIPTLTTSLAQDGETSSRKLVGTVLTAVVAILAAFVLVAEGVIWWLRQSSDSPTLQFAAVLLPYTILICAVAIIAGVLHVRRHFAVPALSPVLLNVFMIACLAGGGLYAELDSTSLLMLLAAGILIAGVIQVVAGLLALRAKSFLPIFSLNWRDARLIAVAKLMAPMMLGLSAVQLSTLADYLIAHFVVTVDGDRPGAAVLAFAQYLYQLPLGVFGISIATAIFPLLAKQAEDGDRTALAVTLARGLRLAVFIALPSSVGLMFVAEPLVRALLEYGAFDAAATTRVSGALFYYSIGLVAYFSHHLIVRTFYALKDSATPARIAGFVVVINVAANISLVFVMEERGLALATALSAFVQLGWLLHRLTASGLSVPWRLIGGGVLQSLIATAAMALVLTWLSTKGIGLLSDAPILRLLFLVGAGMCSYGVAATVLRVPELRQVFRRN